MGTRIHLADTAVDRIFTELWRLAVYGRTQFIETGSRRHGFPNGDSIRADALEHEENRVI